MLYPCCSFDMIFLVSWPYVTMILVMHLKMMCFNGQRYTCLHPSSFLSIIDSTLSHVPKFLSQPSKTVLHLHLGANTLYISNTFYNQYVHRTQLIHKIKVQVRTHDTTLIYLNSSKDVIQASLINSIYIIILNPNQL